MEGEQGHPSAPGGSLFLDDWRTTPLLLVFFIPLPQSVGLPHGATFTFPRDEHVEWVESFWRGQGLPASDENFVSLKLWQRKQRISLPFQGLDAAIRVAELVGSPTPSEKPPEVPIPDFEGTITIIEALTPLIERDEEFSVALTHAFDGCLETINLLLRSYHGARRELLVRPISRQVLPISIPWVARNPLTNEWSDLGLFLVNSGTRLPYQPEPVDEAGFQRFAVFLSRFRAGDPFARYIDWYAASQRAAELEGDCAAALIALHTSGEVLLNTVLLMMAWEEGLSRAETQVWFEEGFAKRLRTYYAPRLGGSWDLTAVSGTIGAWVRYVHEPRGRVVHGGHIPSHSQLTSAFSAHRALEERLGDRLAIKRLTYPRTALSFLGQPGLERRALYSGRLRQFAEQTQKSGEAKSWIADYLRWLA